MTPRLNAFAVAPHAMEAMLTLEAYVRGSGLEPTLIELVKTRASQINHCAYCVEMHTRGAREAGEREERLHLLTAWQESSFYTDRERAALAWTETLTLVAQTHAPEEVYESLRAQFTPEEMVNLTLLIGAINVWNRIAVGFRNTHPAREPVAV